MMAQTHVVFGVVCYLGGAQAAGIAPSPAGGAVAILGALLPDIDHPKSVMGRWVPFLSVPLSKILGHRGLTHSLLALVAAAGLGMVAATHWPGFGFPLALGYLSHLLGDFFTGGGIPLLYPSTRRYTAPLRVAVGGLGEKLVFLGLTLTLAVLIHETLPERFRVPYEAHDLGRFLASMRS